MSELGLKQLRCVFPSTAIGLFNVSFLSLLSEHCLKVIIFYL